MFGTVCVSDTFAARISGEWLLMCQASLTMFRRCYDSSQFLATVMNKVARVTFAVSRASRSLSIPFEDCLVCNPSPWQRGVKAGGRHAREPETTVRTHSTTYP
jgi:hypothetical protein